MKQSDQFKTVPFRNKKSGFTQYFNFLTNQTLFRKVDENVIKVLVGNEKEFTMKHYGGEPFTPERLLEEISKVSYSGINWKGLKI